jgi:hypothetical protein
MEIQGVEKKEGSKRQIQGGLTGPVRGLEAPNEQKKEQGRKQDK